MKRLIACLILIVKVYSGSALIGSYRINNMRDIVRTEQNRYIIDCIDRPKRCEVTIFGPAILVVEEETNAN